MNPAAAGRLCTLEGHNQRLPRCQHHHLLIGQVHTVPHHPNRVTEGTLNYVSV